MYLLNSLFSICSSAYYITFFEYKYILQSKPNIFKYNKGLSKIYEDYVTTHLHTYKKMGMEFIGCVSEIFFAIFNFLMY